MGDWWMDDRQRRERGWRSESYVRGEWRPSEGRSFEDEHYGARRGGPDRDRVFGERDTGAEYNRSSVTRGGGYGGQGFSGEAQDYTRGGRFYGDDGRAPIYRSEYGQGGRQYGRVPEGYDAGRPSRASYDNAALEQSHARDLRRRASGGTGGYDYERGYGDGGRETRGRGPSWQDRDYSGASPAFYQGYGDDRDFGGRGDRFEARAYRAGQGLRRVGERISNFLGDIGFEEGGTDHRGRGPKGYRRSDDRIRVSAGEVTLSGSVENREAKRRAEHLAEDLTGVTNVRNDLRVGVNP